MSAVTVEQDGICPEHGEDYIELVSMSPDGSGCDYICWECWHKDRERRRGMSDMTLFRGATTGNRWRKI